MITIAGWWYTYPSEKWWNWVAVSYSFLQPIDLIFLSTNRPLLNARSMASTIHAVRFPKAPPPTALRYTSAKRCRRKNIEKTFKKTMDICMIHGWRRWFWSTKWWIFIDFFHSYVGVRGGYRLGSSLDEACGLAIQFLWARFFSDIFGETCGREGTKADND